MIKSFARNTNSRASGCALTSSSEELNPSCSKPKVPSGERLPQTWKDMDHRPWLLSLLSTLGVLFAVECPAFPSPKAALWQSEQEAASVPAGLGGVTEVSRPGFAEDPIDLPAPSFVCTHSQRQIWHCLCVLEPGPSLGSFPAQAIPHSSFGAHQPVRQHGAAHTRHQRCLVYRWQGKCEFWIIALS